MVPRKSAQQHKIDAVITEFGSNAHRLREKLAQIENEVNEANVQHEARLEEKTATLQQNIKYYGSKVQELIQELVYKQPFDQDTGMHTTLKSTVVKLGIDQDKIKFDIKDECFTNF